MKALVSGAGDVYQSIVTALESNNIEVVDAKFPLNTVGGVRGNASSYNPDYFVQVGDSSILEHILKAGERWNFKTVLVSQEPQPSDKEYVFVNITSVQGGNVGSLISKLQTEPVVTKPLEINVTPPPVVVETSVEPTTQTVSSDFSVNTGDIQSENRAATDGNETVSDGNTTNDSTFGVVNE